MMKATIEGIYKNNRYRLMDSETERYLIDTDISTLGYLCFAINWLVPQKVYQLNERDMYDLKVQHVESNKINGVHLVMVGLVIGVCNFLIPMWVRNAYSNSEITYQQILQMGDNLIAIPPIAYIVLMLVSYTIPAVIIRVFLSIRAKKALLSKVNYTKFPESTVRFVPTDGSNVVKGVMVYLFFLAFVLLAGILVVVLEGHWVTSLIFTVIFLLFLMTNYLSVSLGPYKIR